MLLGCPVAAELALRHAEREHALRAIRDRRGGFGGIRIEDDVLITAAGCELLTR